MGLDWAKKQLKRAERERTGIQITMALPGAVLVVIRNGMAWHGDGGELERIAASKEK